MEPPIGPANHAQKATTNPSISSFSNPVKLLPEVRLRPRTSYGATLIRTGSTVPLFLVATIITAVVYFAPLKVLDTVLPAYWMSVLLGLSITLVLWLLFSFFTRDRTTFNLANALISSRLKSRLLTLSALIHSWEGNGIVSENEPHVEQVYEYFGSINHLDQGGSVWVLGTGYLEIGQFLDRAEEAMIEFAPEAEVIREAIFDEVCLEGSAIGAREDWLNKLRTAVQKLDSSAGIYMKPFTIQANVQASSPYAEQAGARSALSSVKRALNSYRYDLWEALVRLRNQLLSVTLIVTLFTYVLLCFAILSGTSAAAIMAITIFYFLGVFSGLFSRLSTESRAGHIGDDYGVTMACIVLTPIMSGLSAIVGVLIVAMGISLLHSPLKLESVYDATRALNVLAAAVFGLFPNLLVNTIQRQSSRYVALFYVGNLSLMSFSSRATK